MEINRRKRTNEINVWIGLSYLILFIIVSPLFYIFLNSFKKNTEITENIFKYLLKDYVVNTLILVVFTTLFSIVIGFLIAYFEVFYDYKFKKILRTCNLLSFAIPSYIFGYIYTDIFTSFSLVHFNIYIDIQNIYGSIAILTIAFYPYVYIVSKSYLKKISMNLVYSSQLLGKNSIQTFFKLIIPLSKAPILLGGSLVFMETLNAFGVPFFFGLPVFSTGIYDSWIGYYDLDGAIKLSSILMFFVLLILFCQKILFRNIFFYNTGEYEIKSLKLNGLKEIGVLSFIFFVVVISFIIPVLYLFRWVKYSYKYIFFREVYNWTLNTLFILIVSSLLILIISIFTTNVKRGRKNRGDFIIDSLSTVGYSTPSSIIAIGFLSIFIFIDRSLFENKFIFINSIVPIVFAYSTRFLSLSYNNINTHILKIGNSYHESSRLLGKSHLYTFFNVDLPMLKSSIISSFLLVSIEILKEMPIVALLYNKNTLSIQMKNYASDERLSMVGIPALILISITSILILIYNKGEN